MQVSWLSVESKVQEGAYTRALHVPGNLGLSKLDSLGCPACQQKQPYAVRYRAGEVGESAEGLWCDTESLSHRRQVSEREASQDEGAEPH